jgi:two-component system response regulator
MVAGPPTLLLVEDNPNDLELALRALRRGRPTSRVVVARDGVEAMEYVLGQGQFSDRDAAEQPRVILLDMKLPRLSGLEVLQRLKADPRTRGIPVVMLTSSAQEADLQRCYSRGANSYIVKPVDLDEFTETVDRLGSYWLVLNQPDREAGGVAP